MLFRWQSEPVDLPDVQMARVMLEIPVITTEGQRTISVPIVVDLDDLSQLSAILTQNGYHYSVQPVEVGEMGVE